MQADYYILIVNKPQNEFLTECSVCNKEFLSENELLTHCKIIHRPITINFENKINCAFCETCELLYEEDSFTDHFPCNAVDIRCFFCLTTMPMKSHFSSHNLTYHSWRKFQCNLCETDTKQMTFAELNEHMRLHNDYGCGVYQCVNCDLFMEKSALPGHVEHCHRGCRCFNDNELCVCDKFNEIFYITKILLADIALNLHKTSLATNKTTCSTPKQDWRVTFVDEKSADNASKELQVKNIPTLLLEVDSEPENTLLEDEKEDEPEKVEDEIDVKNPDFEHIFLTQNYQQIISNIKTEDLTCDEEKSGKSPENYEQTISNLKSEDVEENSQGSSHNIEELSESEIISYLKSEQDEHNHKRGRKKNDGKKCIAKKSKTSEPSEKKCVVCGLKFEKEAELEYHGVVHHRPWAVEVLKDIFCVRCKSWFDSEKEYKTQHPCTKEPVTNRCQVCNMQFPFKEHFLLHKINFITPRRLICLLCEDSSTEFQIYQLNKHRKTEHQKNGVFECLKCDVNFVRSCDLKRHIIESCTNDDVESIAETYKLKTNDRDVPEHFSCEVCSKIFISKISLKQHMATHNHGGIKLCFVCGRSFKKVTSYKEHMNIHLKTKTYDCSSCEKKFFKPNYLRQHEKIHKENKNFPCSFCSKTFVQQTSLIYHMAGHTKENMFVCSVCGEKWDTQRKLTAHMEMHNADGTNPHKCLVCQKFFTHKCNLLVHMRMHAETSKEN